MFSLRAERVRSAARPPPRPVVMRRPAATAAPGRHAATLALRPPPAEIPYRHEMERAFGEDLSDVRAHLHRGPELEAIGARAATVGARDVVFGHAEPDRRTVAHELAHVVQARRAAPARGGVTAGAEASEREADAAAGSVARGERPTVREAPAAAVQRDKSVSGKISGGTLEFKMLDWTMRDASGAKSSSMGPKREHVTIEYVPDTKPPAGVEFEFVQAVKTESEFPEEQAKADKDELKRLADLAAKEKDPDKKKELEKEARNARIDQETNEKLTTRGPVGSVRYETKAGENLASIVSDHYWWQQPPQYSFQQIFDANATVLRPLMPNGVDPQLPLPAGTVLFLVGGMESGVQIDVFGRFLGGERTTRSDSARSPAYITQQKMVRYGGPIDMYDEPGANLPTKFTFETALLRKDTGTWLGGVRWGFTTKLPGIINEWAGISPAVSDSFTAALDQFTRVYKNPHRAMAGDTLSGLAARFLGNPNRWPEIASLNPSLKTVGATDPIAPGTMVEIPGIAPQKP